MAICTSTQAGFDPVELTPGSFTADVVVESTALRPIASYTTATMDGGTNNSGQTWFARGFDVSRPTIGLPASGSTFVAESDPNRSFTLAPSYTNASNALLVYAKLPNGTLAITAPTPGMSLSVLSAAAGGNTSVDYILHYADGGTQTGSLTVLDWFNQSPIAVTANGRTDLGNGRINNASSGNPRLTYGDIALNDTVNAVTNIEFTCTNAGRAAIFGVSISTDSVTYTPLTVTGFNRDLVVEAGVTPSGCLYGKTTVVMDSGSTNNTGNTFYEVGFNTNAGALTTGLPAHDTLVSDVYGHTFRMPPDYTTNNVAYVANLDGYTTATLTLVTPTVFTGLSFLNTAGNGPVLVDVTIHYADSTTETTSFGSPDWFGNDASTFYKMLGRFDPSTLALNNVNDGAGNPRIHTNDIALVNATASAVTSIEFTWFSGGRAAILAVAGQTTVGGAYSPVAVTGYNADAVVEAGVARLPAPCAATTATMDGGVNNTGNTWYEQGYYAYTPASGLPPAGSLLTSLAQPDHQYRLAASYTANNAAFVDSLRSNVNLTLANPTNYSALSFLSATANNSVTNQCIVQYLDGTMETNTFVSRDWFNNAPYAFSSLGRVNVENRSVNNTPADTATPNPRLYEAQFALGNTTSPVTNILVRFLGAVNPTTGRMVIFAVSASAGAFSPILTTVSPSPAGAYVGGNLSLIGGVSGGTEPITYRWQFRVNTAGTFTDLVDGGVIAGASTTNLVLTGIGFANAGEYRLVATNSAGFGISSVGNVTVLSALSDVTRPGDVINRINGTVGGGGSEGEANAINNTTQKYLNFDEFDSAAPFVGPVGFVVEPSLGQTVSGGLRSILQGVRIYTANDAEERDPADITIEGSDDLAMWTLISSNSLALPSTRNAGNANPMNPFALALQEVLFPNSTSYLAYRVTFYNVKNNAAANSMQLGEIELLGTLLGPQLSVAANQDGTLTITSPTPGTLLSATNLSSPVIWADEGPISGSVIVTPSPGEPQKFYRVVVP